MALFECLIIILLWISWRLHDSLSPMNDVLASSFGGVPAMSIVTSLHSNTHYWSHHTVAVSTAAGASVAGGDDVVLL